MTPSELRTALQAASEAARAAGALMHRNLHGTKRVNETSQHDIKLELDVRCQKRIERTLLRALPAAAILGEEGTRGSPDSPLRWVVDPIDGTVNFAYGIPHACVSIALQVRDKPGRRPDAPTDADGFRTVLGVIFDPFTDELWSATDGTPARLNGRVIRVQPRKRLDEAIVALGFAKYRHTLDRMLPVFEHLIHRVRKIRITGSAALCLAYVATGRFDAYIENGVRLWDIAAGGFILRQAGGVFWRRPVEDADQTFELRVSAPPLQPTLHRLHARLRPTP
jgi:myo-inositol-1(or 4)-monophosphatase